MGTGLNNSKYFSKNQIDLLENAKNNKKYIHLKNENSELKEIMSLKNLNDIISTPNYWNKKNFLLVLDKKNIPFEKYSTLGDEYGFFDLSPDPLIVEKFIKKGASLVLNNLNYLSDNIKNLTLDLQKITNGKCQANLYFSMQSHQAFAPHFDTHDVFALHCAGEKVWNIYENFENDPINHQLFKSNPEERAEKCGKIIDQVLLQPGDLLYLPRGQFHDALASRSGAIHIAFGITYMKPLDLFQYYWEEYIIDDYFRSDIRAINNENDIEKLHEKISNEFKRIFNNKKLFAHSINYFNSFPYKIVNYNIEKIVDAGVQYEISPLITLMDEGEKLLLASSKSKVPIPPKFKNLVKYTFKEKLISLKSCKKEFPELSDEMIIEYIDAMKNMKVFV